MALDVDDHPMVDADPRQELSRAAYSGGGSIRGTTATYTAIAEVERVAWLCRNTEILQYDIASVIEYYGNWNRARLPRPGILVPSGIGMFKPTRSSGL
jgi:hypothetical protein